MYICISYWLFLWRTQRNYYNPSTVRVPRPLSTRLPCVRLKSIRCMLDTDIILRISLIGYHSLCVCVTHLCTERIDPGEGNRVAMVILGHWGANTREKAILLSLKNGQEHNSKQIPK